MLLSLLLVIVIVIVVVIVIVIFIVIIGNNIHLGTFYASKYVGLIIDSEDECQRFLQQVTKVKQYQ